MGTKKKNHLKKITSFNRAVTATEMLVERKNCVTHSYYDLNSLSKN